MEVLPVTDSQKSRILMEMERDLIMIELSTVIKEGWPTSKNQCSDKIKMYWSLQEELSVVNGLVFKGTRMMIP